MKKSKKTNKYKNLGYANSWNKTPIELTNCKQKSHRLGFYNNCGVSTYFCSICKIEYKIDSTD